MCLFGALGYIKVYALAPTVNVTNTAITVLPGGTFNITATIIYGDLLGALTKATLTNPAGVATVTTLSGTANWPYTSATITASTTPGTYLYTLSATETGTLGGGTSANKTITVTVSKTYDWKGTTSVFSTGTNWNPTGPPTATDIAQIGVVAYTGANQPNVGTSTGVFQLVFGTNNTPALTVGSGNILTVGNDVVVNSGGTASLAGTGTLAVTGNFTNNATATFTAAAGSTTNFAGGTQTLTNANITASPTVAFGNLQFSGGAKTFAAGGYYSVAAGNVMTLGASTTVTIPNTTGSYTHLAFLTDLTSPYVNYAQIATIPAGSSIQGNIDYPVNFTGGASHRNYRSMASPVYDNTTTYTASNGTYKYSNLKSTFIITGTGGATNGFDLSSNNGSTIKNYVPATNIYTFLSSLTGRCLWCRCI